MGQGAEKRLKWFIVLKAAEHRPKNQHHRHWGSILSEVEALKPYFTIPVKPKTGEYVNDVVGFPNPVNNELIGVGDFCWIDQGLGSDVLADQLIGIASPEAAFR